VHRIAAVLLSAVALALAGIVATPSPSPARAGLPALSVDAGTAPPLAARGSRGFGSRPRSARPRETPRQRAARRARNRGIANSVLRALGLAWLFSVLFGIGSGGSPVGLLIVGAFVLWLVLRSRRTRRRRSAYGY
jgi:Flp pilus assembly protein TadB